MRCRPRGRGFFQDVDVVDVDLAGDDVWIQLGQRFRSPLGLCLRRRDELFDFGGRRPDRHRLGGEGGRGSNRIGADLLRQTPQAIDDALVFGGEPESAQVGAEGAYVVFDFGFDQRGCTPGNLDLFGVLLGAREELAFDIEGVFPASGDLRQA